MQVELSAAKIDLIRKALKAVSKDGSHRVCGSDQDKMKPLAEDFEALARFTEGK